MWRAVSKHRSLWKPGAASPKPSNKAWCGAGAGRRPLSGPLSEAERDGMDYSVLQAAGLDLPPWLGLQGEGRRVRQVLRDWDPKIRAERDLQRQTKGVQRQRKAGSPSKTGRCGKVEDKSWSESETTLTDNRQGGTDSQTGRLPGRESVCLRAGRSHRAMTEMDGLVTEGDKPEAGGNIEADNKGRED